MNNNQNGFQQPNNWQQPENGQNFTHNMPPQQVNEQTLNQGMPQQPVQNVQEQQVQSNQQPVWNNMNPNQNQQVFGGQANTPNAAQNNAQQGTHQTNRYENNTQQNNQGQTFQQTGTNQQFNQVNQNQQYQQNGNMNFQQNYNGQNMNLSSMPKKKSKYFGLFLATMIMAGISAVSNLSASSGIDDLWWLFDSMWLSSTIADITRLAAIAMTSVVVLTFIGWKKENRWLIFAAIITSGVGILCFSYLAIGTLVLLIIAFVGMTKDSKKQNNFY